MSIGSNRETRERCKNFEFWSFWTLLLDQVGPVHFWCISGVQLPAIQQICYALSVFDHCYMLFSRCVAWCLCTACVHFSCGRWRKLLNFLGLQLFKCLAASADLARGKRNPAPHDFGPPDIWVISSTCLSKLMRKLSGPSRAPTGIRNSVSVILWIVWCDAKQTGKINWNWLDEGNECGLFMFSFD
jgi:hypothetical protein